MRAIIAGGFEGTLLEYGLQYDRSTALRTMAEESQNMIDEQLKP